jgi:hypothetical protein
VSTSKKLTKEKTKKQESLRKMQTTYHDKKDTASHIVTRRIRLLINTADKQELYDHWSQLRHWQHNCFRAANYIITHRFVQEQLKDMIYLDENMKAKLADNSKDPAGIFNCSKQHTTYRLMASYFKGDMPMHIISSLNATLMNVFSKEREQYYKGERSLRSYRADIPVPFKAEDICRFTWNDEKNGYTFNLFGVPFTTYLGRDSHDKKALIQQWQQGKVKLCTSSLQLKDNRIYMLAVFEVPHQPASVDENIIAEASLSIEHPLIVVINGKRYTIGNKEEFLYRRIAIQAARQRLQQAVSFNNGGHGRRRKLKALNRLKETEKNHVQSKLHLYSRQLISVCIKHQAGCLLLTGQHEEAMAKEDTFLMRNWSYYDLQQKIQYKAARVGIMVIQE